MTAVEKARELYNKYNPHCLTKSFYGDDIERQSTKQCALIAVDEILKTFPNINGIAVYKDHVVDIEYWQQVKEQIENL